MKTTCPNCGAPLEAEGSVAVVVCEFCSAYSLVHKGELSLAGKVAPLAESTSRLQVGMTGKVAGRPFTAVGRVRYDYDDGLWDEWNLFFEDGTFGWLQEDEGELTLFDERSQAAGNAAPEVADAGPGSTVEALGRRVFVTETGEATVVGGQGQITSHLSPGARFAYVDGLVDGRQAVVMAAPAVTVLFLGRPVEPHELEI